MFSASSQRYKVFFPVYIRAFVFHKRFVVIDIGLDALIVAGSRLVERHQLLRSGEKLGYNQNSLITLTISVGVALTIFTKLGFDSFQ